eukprot:snap_masked-scaffold967_size75526-processed-gene-0.2 protein:Tk01305 transcript:snap_masked-scaffold967_size75526-processed-gene-0.2-mRNA-1 annotation:"hypothetical protein AaeL_AAEL009580"
MKCFTSLLVISSLAASVAAQDFECPQPEGSFPHPVQCDRYFQCSGGDPARRLCPDGLVFDPDKAGSAEDPCDHIQNTKHKCQGRPELQRPKPGDGNCPRQNGVYPSPIESECDRFYSCLNGVGSSQQCAEGLHFDPEIGTCVWARESTRKGCLSNSERQTQQVQAQPDITTATPAEALSNGFTCPGGKLGVHLLLPHPTSCILYYVCLNGINPSEASCSGGTVFNRYTQKCDEPENVEDCGQDFSTSKPKRQSSQGRPQSRDRQSSNNNDSDDGGLDVEQFAKFIELLTNPKVKSILKPEVADALSSFTNTDEESQEVPRPPRRRKRPRRPLIGNQREVEEEEEESMEGNEDTQEESELAENPRSTLPKSSRRIPFNRRNKFTSRFIPRVKAGSNPDNMSPDAFEEDPTETENEPVEEEDVEEGLESKPPIPEDNEAQIDPTESEDEEDERASLPSRRFKLRRPFAGNRRPGFPFRRRKQPNGPLRDGVSPSEEEEEEEEEIVEEEPVEEEPKEEKDDTTRIEEMGEQLLKSLIRPRGRPGSELEEGPFEYIYYYEYEYDDEEPEVVNTQSAIRGSPPKTVFRQQPEPSKPVTFPSVSSRSQTQFGPQLPPRTLGRFTTQAPTLGPQLPPGRVLSRGRQPEISRGTSPTPVVTPPASRSRGRSQATPSAPRTRPREQIQEPRDPTPSIPNRNLNPNRPSIPRLTTGTKPESPPLINPETADLLSGGEKFPSFPAIDDNTRLEAKDLEEEPEEPEEEVKRPPAPPVRSSPGRSRQSSPRRPPALEFDEEAETPSNSFGRGRQSTPETEEETRNFNPGRNSPQLERESNTRSRGRQPAGPSKEPFTAFRNFPAFRAENPEPTQAPSPPPTQAPAPPVPTQPPPPPPPPPTRAPPPPLRDQQQQFQSDFGGFTNFPSNRGNNQARAQPSNQRQPNQVERRPQPNNGDGFQSVSNTVFHDQGSQSSSFFNFQRPEFQVQPAVPQQQQTDNSPSSRFQGQPTFQTFSAFPQPQAARFETRPSPNFNGQRGNGFNLTPAQSQQSNTFFSVFNPAAFSSPNVRAQRAISQSSNDAIEVKAREAEPPKNYQRVEFNFPKPEFGGFVPVERHSRMDKLLSHELEFIEESPSEVSHVLPTSRDYQTYAYEVVVPQSLQSLGAQSRSSSSRPAPSGARRKMHQILKRALRNVAVEEQYVDTSGKDKF